MMEQSYDDMTLEAVLIVMTTFCLTEACSDQHWMTQHVSMCDARGTTHCAVHSNSHSNVERYVILRQTQLKLSIGDTHSQMLFSQMALLRSHVQCTRH